MAKYMMMPRLVHQYTPELNAIVQDLLETIERQKRDGGDRVDDVLGILHAWAFESTCIHAHNHMLLIHHCICSIRNLMVCLYRHCPVCSGEEVRFVAEF